MIIAITLYCYCFHYFHWLIFLILLKTFSLFTLLSFAIHYFSAYWFIFFHASVRMTFRHYAFDDILPHFHFIFIYLLIINIWLFAFFFAITLFLMPFTLMIIYFFHITPIRRHYFDYVYFSYFILPLSCYNADIFISHFAAYAIFFLWLRRYYYWYILAMPLLLYLYFHDTCIYCHYCLTFIYIIIIIDMTLFITLH